MLLPRRFSFSILVCLLILLSAGFSIQVFADEGDPPLPPTRESLEKAEPVMKVKKNEDGQVGLPFNIREDAIREAALSYGARGGLAARTYEIRQDLEKHPLIWTRFLISVSC